MKKLLILGLALICLLSAPFVAHTQKAEAATPMDYIKSYYINATPQADSAKLELYYQIVWEVLEDNGGREPLTWVYVGVPNGFFTITSASGGTASVYNKTHVRMDFSEPIYKGKSIMFNFTILVENIASLDNTGDVVYTFRPGWFEGIDVGTTVISWKKEGVSSYSTLGFMENNRLVFADYLGYDNTEIQVTYDSYFFTNIDPLALYDPDRKLSTSDEAREAFIVIACIIGFVVLVFIIIIIGTIYSASSYHYNRGFNRRSTCRHTNRHYGHTAIWWGINSSNNSRGGKGGGGGGGCACACACACAGGGRAGCSSKGFLGAVEFELIQKRIELEQQKIKESQKNDSK